MLQKTGALTLQKTGALATINAPENRSKETAQVLQKTGANLLTIWVGGPGSGKEEREDERAQVSFVLDHCFVSVPGLSTNTNGSPGVRDSARTYVFKNCATAFASGPAFNGPSRKPPAAFFLGRAPRGVCWPFCGGLGDVLLGEALKNRGY